MGRVIVIGAVVIIMGFLVVGLVMYLRRQDSKELAAEKGWAIKGDLSKAQEQDLRRRLDQGLELVAGLLTDSDWMNGTILAEADRAALTAWVQNTTKYLKEGIK